MTKVILNGAYMYSKEMAHMYMKWKLKTPQYYGKNLDALWDVLSTYSEPIEIWLTNKDQLMAKLGDYGEAIIRTFQDAEQENSNICFAIIENGGFGNGF